MIPAILIGWGSALIAVEVPSAVAWVIGIVHDQFERPPPSRFSALELEKIQLAESLLKGGDWVAERLRGCRWIIIHEKLQKVIHQVLFFALDEQLLFELFFGLVCFGGDFGELRFFGKTAAVNGVDHLLQIQIGLFAIAFTFVAIGSLTVTDDGRLKDDPIDFGPALGNLLLAKQCGIGIENVLGLAVFADGLVPLALGKC